MMRFSLIVCTLGRCDELTILFDSLLRQNRSDFETILVDQNSDDRLVPVVARFAAHLPIQHIRISGTGASRARNVGLDHASGELIGFPDDDCRYLDGYLDAVDRIFSEDASIGCISGHPTSEQNAVLGTAWDFEAMDLKSFNILDRCQEFTIFLRAQKLWGLRYNQHLGVGAQTPWGAEEGPDFLIRLVQSGCRLVYMPRLFVYHPDKISQVNRATLQRAASYARGRGCLFRLHRFPRKTIARSLLRPAIGCGLYLVLGQPKRSIYYFAIVRGTLRGLLLSKAELAMVQDASQPDLQTIEAIPLRPLSPPPLVSVLIANYNYARFLPETLDSLLSQTYAHWHAIVCDDGSTDNSTEVIEEYANRDPRIQLLRKSNGGQNSAFNACYQQVRGQVVCLLDADDIFDPRKIERVVESFMTHTDAGLCHHSSQVINDAGLPHGAVMHRRLDAGWLAETGVKRGACVYVPTTSCMSMRRDVADLLFPIPPQQDRDLDGYVGMAGQFLAPICVIDEQLTSYRIHANNMGGLTEPTPQRLRYELHLIELRTSTLKQFLQNHLGERVSQRIRIEENPQYIQAALKLLAIEREDGRASRASALIRLHPSARWRAIWRAIFAAPRPVSRLMVPLLHRSHRFKAVAHRFMGRVTATA